MVPDVHGMSGVFNLEDAADFSSRAAGFATPVLLVLTGSHKEEEEGMREFEQKVQRAQRERVSDPC